MLKCARGSLAVIYRTTLISRTVLRIGCISLVWDLLLYFLNTAGTLPSRKGASTETKSVGGLKQLAGSIVKLWIIRFPFSMEPQPLLRVGFNNLFDYIVQFLGNFFYRKNRVVIFNLDLG